LRGDLIVLKLRLKDILDEFLRVAIVERKPGALHLHHHAMTFLETVIGAVQID